MKRFLTITIFVLLAAGPASRALAAHHRHHHTGAHKPQEIKLDLTPVVVQPYVLPSMTSDPARFNFLRRMNLENGVEVRSTRWIRTPDVTTRNLFILDVTQSLEGGFDSVNLYDKGVLSWGVMQWTAGTGSLPPVLIYIKRRLMQTKQTRVWTKVFTAQGIEANARGLIAFGKPLSTPAEMRLAFRGSQIVGNYDPKVAGYWATVFARAGRQPAIQQFQREYAQQVVDDVLSRSLPGIPCHAPGRAATVSELTGGDPYAQALIFALWTNNPRHAREYIAEVAAAVAAAQHTCDPRIWTAGTFREALLRRCQASRFGNWRQRGTAIKARFLAMRSASPSVLSPFERECQTQWAAQKAHRLLLAGRRKPLRHSDQSARLLRPVPASPE